jgi:tetratricopeptide (TPR) repeat protein
MVEAERNYDRKNIAAGDRASDQDRNQFLFDMENANTSYHQSIVEAHNELDNPAGVVEASTAGIDASEKAWEYYSALNEPGTPEYLDALDASRSLEMFFYQSMVVAYRDLGQPANVIEAANDGLAAKAASWDQYSALVGEGTPEYSEALETDQSVEFFFLQNLMTARQSTLDAAGMIDAGRKILEISPDDLQTLMNVSTIMVQTPPEGAGREGYLEEARGYAERSVEALGTFLAGPDSANLDEATRANLMKEAHSTLGLAAFQLEEWEAAASHYEDALGLAPNDPLAHYMLGLSHNNDQDLDGALSALARAVFLEFPDAQARTSLEALYQRKNGSLDGLDEYIQSEGARIGQ